MMPDLLLLPMVDALFAFPEGAGMLAENPSLRRFHDAFKERPSYAATLPKERPPVPSTAAAA
jgi:glutathione S-transferase